MAAKDKWKQRGEDDFKAGKAFESNPYLTHPQIAKSSWWQAGWIKAKQEQQERL